MMPGRFIMAKALCKASPRLPDKDFHEFDLKHWFCPKNHTPYDTEVGFIIPGRLLKYCIKSIDPSGIKKLTIIYCGI